MCSVTKPTLTYLGDQYWKKWFSVLLQKLGSMRKYYPVDWVNLSKRGEKNRVFQGLAGLLRGISRGQSPREILRSSSASPRKTPSFPTLLLRFTFYFQHGFSKFWGENASKFFLHYFSSLLIKNCKFWQNFLLNTLFFLRPFLRAIICAKNLNGHIV